MLADRIHGGTLVLGGNNNYSGVFSLRNELAEELVRMDNRGIVLANGAKLIGGNGVLSNFQFVGQCSTKGDMVGFLDINDDELVKTKILIDVNIPENFEIIEAKVILTHSPILYTRGVENIISFWGYTRKIRICKVTNLNYKRVAGLYSEYADSEDIEFVETNGFNGGVFNPKIPSNSDYQTETVQSLNLKNYINPGKTVLMIDSQENTPAKKGDWIEQNAYSRTGQVKAILNIVGFMS